MTLSAYERQQPHTVFFEAGQTAFLIGVLAGNNPYHDENARDAWEKGHAKAKAAYHTHYPTEVKLAAFLGYAPPKPPQPRPARTFQRPPQRMQQKPLKPGRSGAYQVQRPRD